jgi:pimeloyl-ACP methyl ester carboxylesterase
MTDQWTAAPAPGAKAPHLADAPLVTSRRGHFWISGEPVATASGTAQRAPLFVAWEAPAEITQPYPLVLIHGGGGQGTDWTGTVDGRPGWATRFVEAGFAVYVVDRAGHGRSPYHPDVVGPMGGPFPYEAGKALFLPDEAAADQTQWTYSRDIGSDGVDQLLAGMGPLPADLGYSQALDAERLGRLLDRIGPAVLVTHSAGGPVGWLTADARPELVKGIAAIEPMGPAFVEFPGLGRLDWGLTAAPITYDPPLGSAAEAEAADPASLAVPALAGTPVAVVTGGASAFAGFAPQVVDFLAAAGADAEWLHLPESGIEGNGHGLIFEANSDETVKPVIAWLQSNWPQA